MRKNPLNNDQANGRAGMKEQKGSDLYPPVLPSWGSMLPSSPPSNGYSNVRFDPLLEAPESNDGIHATFDEQAIGFLKRIFRRRPRPI